MSVLSGETYIIYIESLEFPPTVKQIDPKYLPVLTVNFELAPNEDQTISATADQTHEAVLTALMSGRKVEGVVRVMGMGQAFYLPFVTWTEVSTLDLDYNLSIAFAGFSCAGNEGTNKTFFKVTMLASGYIETDYDTGNV